MSETPPQMDTALSEILDKQLRDANYSLAVMAIKDNRYNSSLQNNCSDTVSTVMHYLTDDIFSSKPELYETCETILKTVAEKSNPEEALFEFLEIVETTKSDNVFTSTLKALQICLQRQKDHKSRSLEWCLNSIQTYISELPFSKSIKSKLDAEEEKLLEENDEVRRILTNYLTLFLFYDPILNNLAKTPVHNFRNVGITRKNVLACFILQLLGPPLSFLDLSDPDRKPNTNTYSRQCSATLVEHFSRLYPDPFFLFSYVERRIRWPIKYTNKDGVYEAAPKDIFALEEKVPLIAIGIFYYLIFAENLMPEKAPKVYTNLYLFEMGLYLVSELFKTSENSLHNKAIRLCQNLLALFGTERISCHTLDLNIHETFCNGLIKVITQTQIKRNSQNGTTILRNYIYRFDDEGRYSIIRNLFHVAEHNGLYGYLISLYKNLVAESLEIGQNQIGRYFQGKELKALLLENICIMKKGSETDLLQNSDQIIAALNMIRFLAIRDKHNQTTFWDFVDIVENNFLLPLRTGIDLTRAHYKLEEQRVKDGTDNVVPLEITISDLPGPEINQEQKLSLIESALNTFELIESLLSRVNECLDEHRKM